MTSLSRDFNMAAPEAGDTKTDSPVIETDSGQDSPVFSEGQVKGRWSSSSLYIFVFARDE